MARFIHITDARDVAKIRRNGLRAKPTLWCVPMTADPSAAFQWARELRRGRGYRTSIAIVFTLPDDLCVTVGRYAQAGVEIEAAQAAVLFRAAPDARGMEVRVRERVPPGAIDAIRAVPRNAGWRFYPEAKGRRPFWPSRGEVNARRLRRAINAEYESPFLALAPEPHSG